MCVVVDLEADGDAFGSGVVVYIRYVRQTSADGEASDHWSRSVVEVGSDRKLLGLLGWCECSLHEKTFGMG